MRPDEYAAMYQVEDHHWWYTGMRRVLDGLLGPHLDGRAGRLAILDAGCGTGGNSRHLQRYGRVIGLDAAAEALHLARNRPGLTLVRGSVDCLPFRDAVFDLVLSNDVLCHLFVQDDVRAVREFARVLRPGGLLYLQLPAFDRLRSHHDAAVFTRHRYTAGEVRHLLRAGGLCLRRVTYANALLFPAAAAWRIVQRARAAQAGERSDVRPVPRPLNAGLCAALSCEAPLLARWNLPFGLSVIGVAQKL